MQIICDRVPRCPFRVGTDYFTVKTRFQPGQCANCGGPVVVVEDFTDTPVVPAMRIALADGDGGAAKGTVIAA